MKKSFAAGSRPRRFYEVRVRGCVYAAGAEVLGFAFNGKGLNALGGIVALRDGESAQVGAAAGEKSREAALFVSLSMYSMLK